MSRQPECEPRDRARRTEVGLGQDEVGLGQDEVGLGQDEVGLEQDEVGLGQDEVGHWTTGWTSRGLDDRARPGQNHTRAGRLD